MGFSAGELMCFASRLSGTFRGPPPALRHPVLHRRALEGRRIAEEWLFYDQYDFLSQLGLLPPSRPEP